MEEPSTELKDSFSKTRAIFPEYCTFFYNLRFWHRMQARLTYRQDKKLRKCRKVVSNQGIFSISLKRFSFVSGDSNFHQVFSTVILRFFSTKWPHASSLCQAFFFWCKKEPLLYLCFLFYFLLAFVLFFSHFLFNGHGYRTANLIFPSTKISLETKKVLIKFFLRAFLSVIT